MTRRPPRAPMPRAAPVTRTSGPSGGCSVLVRRVRQAGEWDEHAPRWPRRRRNRLRASIALLREPEAAPCRHPPRTARHRASPSSRTPPSGSPRCGGTRSWTRPPTGRSSASPPSRPRSSPSRSRRSRSSTRTGSGSPPRRASRASPRWAPNPGCAPPPCSPTARTSSNDAAADPRTLDHPLVRGELGLRFYAAAPITVAGGHRLGTVNVIDREPRDIVPHVQLEMLGLARGHRRRPPRPAPGRAGDRAHRA